jgi:hypothetical protein
LPATAQATGKVVTTNPLVVMLDGNVKVNVVAESNTRIMRILPATIADVKVGDAVRAIGQPDENGNVVAMRLEIGVDLNAGFGAGGGAFRQRGAPGRNQQN